MYFHTELEFNRPFLLQGILPFDKKSVFHSTFVKNIFCLFSNVLLLIVFSCVLHFIITLCMWPLTHVSDGCHTYATVYQMMFNKTQDLIKLKYHFVHLNARNMRQKSDYIGSIYYKTDIICLSESNFADYFKNDDIFYPGKTVTVQGKGFHGICWYVITGYSPSRSIIWRWSPMYLTYISKQIFVCMDNRHPSRVRFW